MVLGPILFITFLSDLFLIMNDIGIAWYADDNDISKACGNFDVVSILKTLRMSSEKLFKSALLQFM